MTLSVCALTRDPPARVAAMLSAFRHVADEIVVAVDSSVDPTLLAPLVEVVDCIVRYDYPGTPEMARPWLVSLCRNDTVLMVDGDEVPSAALLEALPRLAGDRDAQQFRIARRWCFPDERSWLAERPWWPDFQRRLVRRTSDLDFDLGFHGGVRELRPVRHVLEPFYHLVCVVRSFSDRRRDARLYDAARPGMIAVGGGPMNLVLYCPDHFATLRPAPTPPEDLDLLGRVLSARDTPSRHVPSLRVVSAEEIISYAPADPMAAQGYRAVLRIVEHDRRTDPGSDTCFLVEIMNTGSTPIWREDAAGVQVRVCTRVVDRRTGTPPQDWIRTELPCDVPPGESRMAEAVVRVPAEPGVYTVEAELLNERGRWFGCLTSAELEVATRWGRYAL